MGSRSRKLKIFLMVDLIVLAVVIPSIFFIDSQISKPADFEITDLILESDWVQFGEPVQISVNVTNIGDKSGNQTVTLTIDEVPISSKTLQLLGGETITVDFTATETTEGNHTITIGDLIAPFKVTSGAPARPANMEITNLGISRIQAGVGEPIIVTATATNTGDVAGNFEITLYVNDDERETRPIQLDSGETKTEEFEVVEQVEDSYEVKVGDLTRSFEITPEAEPPKPAEFQVTSLKINPGSVLAGEVVDISVTITNVGEELGSYAVNLQINNIARETTDVTLNGGATRIVEFKVTETNAGIYNVKIDGMTGSFTVENAVVASEHIKLTRIFVSPYEVWEDEKVTVTASINNTANEEGILIVRLLVNDEALATKQVVVAAGESDAKIEFQVTAGPANPESTKGYPVELVNLGDRNNTLNGYFVVAPDGYHTLSINRSGGGSTPMVFVLDGVTYESPYVKLLPVDEYSLSTDEIVVLKTGIVEFSHWNDGLETEARTFTLDKKISMLANYIVISGYASCPSLYISNGTDYSYVTEVSNAGWLGYIDYIDSEGNIVFSGGNPWDHVKLNKKQFKPITDTEFDFDYYDAVLFQQWDEIFYLDTAYLVVVDHPNSTEVYSTMVNYMSPGFYGEIYTINEDNLLKPISAVNDKGEDVLSQISEIDDVFTSTSNGVLSPSWDNITLNQLTLDLGDLSNAPEIKLVINGMVDWGPAEPYYDWIDQFKKAASEGLITSNTQINPPSYMEVMNAQGNWIQVPQDRQIPIPGDYVPRTFAVDLNGLFANDVSEYKIRITNFWNVTFDYIGIDVSPQEDISVYEILPIATFEPIGFATTTTNASGNFTKHGDVSELLRYADDMFVIGIQGDKVSLKFPTTDLPILEQGMERSFFMFVASWFKDHVGNWGYGFDFTVDPLPFQNMSGFPYPPTENYPSSEEYTQYLEEWNTRAVNIP